MKRFNRHLSLVLIVTFLLSSILTDYNVAFAQKAANSDGSQSISQNEVQQQSQNTNPINLSELDKSVQDTPINQYVYENPDKKDDAKDNTNTGNTQEKSKRIIIKYKDDSRAEAVKAKVKQKLSLSKLETKKKIKHSKLESVEIGENDDIDKTIEELKKDDNVLSVQEDYKLTTTDLPTDSDFTQQWGLQNSGQAVSGQTGTVGMDIDALDAWDITTGNPSVVVGVLDTGIDINHPDLKDNIFVNSKEIAGNSADDDNNGYIDDVTGWDFADDDNSVYDSSSLDMHGTHVAGIIAAEANSIGVRGVAPNIKLLPLKFINGSYGYTSDAIEAIEYAKTMGVKIINCSWGGSDYNQALYDEMQNSGILFICAAGNNGADISSNPVYPAGFGLPNIVSVAATDNTGALAAFSTYGNQVNVAAPGVNILSTLPDGNYGTMSGTSMSTGFVTGTAALLLSANQTLSASDLKSKIEGNTTQTFQLSGKVSSGGIVNAYKVLTGNGQGSGTNNQTASTGSSSVFTPDLDEVQNPPFSFSSSIDQNQAVTTKFDIQDSAVPYTSAILTITRSGEKAAVYTGTLSGTQKELVISNIPAYNEYVFSVEIMRTDTTDIYNGQLHINACADATTGINSTVYTFTTNVFKSPFETSVAFANAVEMCDPTSSGYNPSSLGVLDSTNSTQSSVSILADQYEDYTNNSFGTAKVINDSDNAYGKIKSTTQTDYYKVQFASKGYANFWLGGVNAGNLPADYDIYLYDNTDLNNPKAQSCLSGTTCELITKYPVDIGKTYYIKVVGYKGANDSLNYYCLRAKNYPSTSTGDGYEPNNSLSTAPSVFDQSVSGTPMGTYTVHGSIDSPSDIDYYKFAITTKSSIAFRLHDIPINSFYPLAIYDASQNQVAFSNFAGSEQDISATLNSGTYYMKVYSGDGIYKSINVLHSYA